MDRLKEELVILLCLCGLVSALLANVEPYSTTPRQSRNLNQPEVVSTFKRFEENAPTLIKIVQVLSEVILVFVWFIDAGLNIFLWIVNEAVTSCTEFSFCIFGALFNVVKLLEALGFGVKFLLEVNYTLVSRLFDTAGFLKESVQHVVILVRITLANETDHIYESGSMAFEGVHNLLLTTCYHTWGKVLLVWDRLLSLVSLIVENFTGYFHMLIPNIPVIASMMLAAVKFFLESIVVTVGVISDGFLFLFKYISDIILEFATKLLANMLVIFRTLFNMVAMVMQYIIFLVTWPVQLFADIIFKMSNLAHSLWEVIVERACWLDSTARTVIWLGLKTVSQLVMTLVSAALNFIRSYIPGGVIGLCVIVLAACSLFVWRKDVVLYFNSTWLYLRNNAPNGNGQEVQEEATTDEEVEYANPETFVETETAEDQNKLFHELEREKDKRLCVICQDKVKNVLLLPCRHVCLCQRCLEEIRHGRILLMQCPLCRQRVQSTMEVFV